MEENNIIEPKRHLAKAVTWRLSASAITAGIAFAFGLPPKAISGIFFVDLVLKFMLYYYHERIWYKYIKFGIKRVKGKL
jgi:uncharacterized membrane protein